MSQTPARRRFIACVGAAGSVASLTNSGCSTDPDNGINPNAQPFDAGAEGEFTAPVVKVMYSHRAIVGRDALGFYAMSSTCTHAACSVSAPDRGVCIPAGNNDLVIPLTVADTVAVMCCACHNSQFDSQGRVRGGPAPRTLTHFRVTLEDGRVKVDPRVAASISDRAVAMRTDAGARDS